MLWCHGLQSGWCCFGHVKNWSLVDWLITQCRDALKMWLLFSVCDIFDIANLLLSVTGKNFKNRSIFDSFDKKTQFLCFWSPRQLFWKSSICDEIMIKNNLIPCFLITLQNESSYLMWDTQHSYIIHNEAIAGVEAVSDTVDCYVQIFIFHNETGFYQRLGANASHTSIVIDNIVKHLTYRARILAYNRAGDGVLSDVIFVGKTRAFLVLLSYWVLLVLVAVRSSLPRTQGVSYHSNP